MRIKMMIQRNTKRLCSVCNVVAICISPTCYSVLGRPVQREREGEREIEHLSLSVLGGIILLIESLDVKHQLYLQTDPTIVMSGPSIEGAGLGHVVAKHYDNLPERGREQRAESRIIHMRNFNNWIKSTLMNEYLEKVRNSQQDGRGRIRVLDMGQFTLPYNMVQLILPYSAPASNEIW